MKKNKIIFLTLISALLFLGACKDVLDTEPFTSFDEATVWGSKETADAFVTGTVSSVMYGYVNGNQTTWEARTNNSVHNQGGNSFVREELNRDAGDGGLGNFGTIRKCNLIIEKAAEYAGHGLSDTQSKELIAKGKLLRALTYYLQARTMGRFVWVDEVLEPADTISGGLEMPTTKTTTESYTYILADIDAAIPDLPETAKPGELTKGTALAFKSEIALQAAAYESDAAKKKAWLEGAVDAANQVIALGQYSLGSDFGSIFNEGAPYSSEIIFAVYRVKSNTTTEAIAPLQNVMPNTNNDVLNRNGCGPLFTTNGGQPFIGWMWWAPTQNLADQFDVIDQLTGKAVKWNESSQFVDNVQVTNNAPDWATDGEKGEVQFSGIVTGDASISDIMYLHRDKRFYDSFVYDNSRWWNEEIRLTVNGNLWRKTNGGLGPHMSLSNYIFKKGVYNTQPRILAGTPTDYHFVVTRLGRVLLNKAEAILWLAGMGQGDFDEAVSICNETRTTHGKLPEANASSLEEAWNLYLKERRVEMVMENDYYWSLLRWGKHGGFANNGTAPGGKISELTVPPTYIEITNDRKSFYVGTITHGGNDVRAFDESRRYLLPIPQGQINRNPNLGPQNPGW
ncbi:RagB/SusD family nutrient uptake outer membrane protein [Sunxiuqinia sp. sy24]|uniref:RagB/SusD family nutrient uptake outer membrane protein n=1 Tax=Sunxiuqinia sp. sy24 TaxID=3461495 RepID=UPI0040460CF0